jgi:inorganic triphosphatase YgiF
MMREIELKILIDEGAAQQLWARVRALRIATGRRKTRVLRSVYLDTSDHRLKEAGIHLRLRRDGRRWIQTIKTKRDQHGGLSQASEVENAAPGKRPCIDSIPNPGMRDEVTRLVNGSPLWPVCETVVKRSSSELSLRDGTRAELSVDIGEIRAKGLSAELREVEIELIEGRPSGLFDIAKALFPEGGLRFSRLSKAARGYMLAEQGRIEAPLVPKQAEEVALDPAQTAELAALAILRECLDQIALNIVVVRKIDDPEGPHQLRVGLRRLRSAFSVYSSVLKSPEMQKLKREARWLGQEVGRLRDFEVVTNDIVRQEAEAHPEESCLSSVADALQSEARELREDLRKLLAEGRCQAFLIDLARFVETRGWLVAEDLGQTERLAAPVNGLAVQALSKRWKKVSKWARMLETLDADQRHELRKEVKKLRYAVEFLSSLFPTKHVAPFLKRQKRLQTIFGELNDAATARTILTKAGETCCAGSPGAERAIGWIIGASQARAQCVWVGAQETWRKLDEARVFWK